MISLNKNGKKSLLFYAFSYRLVKVLISLTHQQKQK